MPLPLSTKLQLMFAVVFALFAAGIWCVLLRRVPTRTATGVVTGKTFKPAGEHWQQPVGIRSGFWTPNRIPIAECYIFEIQLNNQPAKVQYSLNVVSAREFEVGQRVSVEYEERSIPLIWKRGFVTGMKRLE